MQKLNYQADFVAQGCLKKKLRAKICQNGTVALFLILSVRTFCNSL